VQREPAGNDETPAQQNVHAAQPEPPAASLPAQS
jgi:hypothetical protein